MSNLLDRRAVVSALLKDRGYAAQAAGAAGAPVPEATRKRGRRIEFRVLNPEALAAERAKRGIGR